MRIERSHPCNFVAIVLLLSAASLFAGAANAQAERRTQALRDALTRPLPSEGVRISVVLREPDVSSTRALRREGVRARQAAVFARMGRGRFTLGHRFRNLSGFSGWADAETIAALAADPDVLSVDIDRVAYATTAEGGGLVGATTVKGLGVTGAGVGVAILDTGIDTDHPLLSASLAAEACFCDDAPGPFGCCPDGSDSQTGAGSAEDDEGHGTTVAGVIVSSSSSDEGVAPDASVVAIKVFGATGSGNFSDTAQGLDWVIDNHLTYGIKVVNMSLGDGLEYDNAAVNPCSGSNTANAIAQLKGLGISVFAASGNDGYDAGVAFPACAPSAFAVGGVYDATFSEVGWCGETCSVLLCTDQPATVDTFVCHTNSGLLLDILAPDFRTTVPELGGGTTDVGGTSFASPYAAGLAALLLDADASLSPDEILGWLETGAPMVLNPDNAMSFPRARVDVAVPLLLATCGDGTLEAGEDCDDGNTLGGDCCDANCAFEALGSGCDDEDQCTTVDTCDGAGLCLGSSPLACDDSNGCTDDSCIPESGCSFVPNTLPCDDADACTDGDQCSGGLCVPGPPLVCNDANGCTDDGCLPASGCSFVPNTLPCDDADACTDGDQCSGGACLPGPALACDDANVCTDDACLPSSGCSFVANTLLCDDANACTDGDICAGGVCTSGVLLDCDDLDECTADSCDEVTGCFNEPIVGCPEIPAVPSSSPEGRLMIALGLLGVALCQRRLAARRPGNRSA